MSLQPKLTMTKCSKNVDSFLEACRKLGVTKVKYAFLIKKTIHLHAFLIKHNNSIICTSIKSCYCYFSHLCLMLLLHCSGFFPLSMFGAKNSIIARASRFSGHFLVTSHNFFIRLNICVIVLQNDLCSASDILQEKSPQRVCATVQALLKKNDNS